MMRAYICLIFCLSHLSIQAQESKGPDYATIANKFFKAYEEMDFDQMATYWSDSVALSDFVVSDLYKAQEVFKGKGTVLSLWKQAFSVRPNYLKIDIFDQFTSGHYVVTNLSLESSVVQKGKTAITRGEMFTVFRFEGDKIVEHFDFGDYYTWSRQIESALNGKHKVDQPSVHNIEVAKSYIAAYSRLDIEAMSAFYSDSVEFKDLTAKDVFKNNQFELKGKEAVTEFWKRNLASSKPEYINVEIDGVFYSGSYVMLNTRFSMILPSSWTNGVKNVYINIPIKTVLKIQDGKILRHYDFANYDLYNRQIQLQTRNK